MKRKSWIICLPLVFLICVASFEVAYGDLYWESVTVTKGMPQGLPEGLPPGMSEQLSDQFNKTETSKNYLASSASRTDTSDGIMIIDYDTMTLYSLNPADKTYTKIDMKSMMDNNVGEMMEGMMKDMKITPTNETKEIAGYTCRKCNVSMMGATTEYWTSKDIPAYKEFEKLAKKMEKLVEKNPGLKKMNAAAMSREMDGFPVQTVINVMGMTTTTTLKTIEKRNLSKELFEIPKDYKLVEHPMPY